MTGGHGPGICLGVRLDNGELAVFPEALEQIITEADPTIDIESALRELITEGKVKAIICQCNGLRAHYHFTRAAALPLLTAADAWA